MKAYQVGKYSIYAASSIEEAIALHPEGDTNGDYPAREIPDDWTKETVEGGWPVQRTARELLDAHGDEPGFLCSSDTW